jgi:hypothetical protein
LLTSFKTRSKERHLFYALLTAICVHLEAWYHQDDDDNDNNPNNPNDPGG